MRILYVEDEPGLLRLTTDALSSDGHDVEQAADCLTGLKIISAARSPFDLLITDIETPGSIDGWELAELARRLSPDIAVIYATGASLDLARPVRNGVILPKPFTLTTLLQQIPREPVSATEDARPDPDQRWFVPSAAGRYEASTTH